MPIPSIIEEVSAFERSEFVPFTFPAYQAKLMLPTVEAVGRMIALGAKINGVASGLALGEMQPGNDNACQLYSIWVEPEARCTGIGQKLMVEFESRAQQAGAHRIEAVYRSTLSDCFKFENLLAAAGWSSPQVRMHVFEASYDAMAQSPFFSKPPQLKPEFSLQPWHAVPPTDIDLLGANKEFSVEVWPLNYGDDYHRPSSFGVRWKNELVGWIVNHPKPNGELRFTTSYLREDLQKGGQFAAVIAASVHATPGTGFTRASWTVPMEFPRMVAFARRRLAPFCDRISETRGSYKSIRV